MAETVQCSVTLLKPFTVPYVVALKSSHIPVHLVLLDFLSFQNKIRIQKVTKSQLARYQSILQ